ncbi:MAG: DNA translocase FtsK, partial [Candidatus Contubernalis sp.]|nr:DNA translocase FtsK [Candidatus Contubernalis sp.]
VEAPLEGMSIFEASYRMGIQRQGGGLIGALLAIVLFYFFGEIGSYIVVTTLGIIAFLLIINISLTQLFTMLGRNINGLSPKIKPFFLDLYHILFTEEVDEPGEVTISEGPIISESQSFPTYPENDAKTGVLKPYTGEDLYQGKIEDSGFISEVEETKNRRVNEDKERKQKTGQLTVVVNNEEVLDYNLPELSLLPQRTIVKDKQQNKLAMDRAKVLEYTLKNFGVRVNNIQVHSGPTVTRYELQPAKGVKVSHIVSLADDLALSMAAPGVRIEAPIPGKAAVGIEVPNQMISPVYLRHVMESPVFMESRSLLSIGLGNDIYGNPVVVDLSKMPHLLIAGATGSGKSVCLSAIIISILFKAKPDEVKFLMIDPKYVELNTYNGIPHLLSPVISDKKKASVALKKMVKEMEQRYERFAREGVRDIVSYNDLARRQGDSYNMLPYIIVVIDELADIMMVAPHDVEDAIARLAQMARAAGIHLVIATQRPSVNVITGVIKANITTRIAFAVSSNADSRVILDMGGAEKLIGQGDMLYHPVGILKPKRIQGAFISEKDVKRIVDFIKRQGIAVVDQKIITESEDQAGEPEELDEVFADALKEVVHSGQASISFLQRKFRIGHVRAGRLIDEMERRGIVSGYEGSKARRVLITPEQLPAYLKDLS